MFNQHYKEARRSAFTQTISRLQQTTSEAVPTLIEVMGDQDSPPSSRVTAAKTVLEMAFKEYEIDDLAQRVEDVEQYIQEAKEME